MWCEMDLYKYIDKMHKKEQLFFTKLYGYEIFNNQDNITKTIFLDLISGHCEPVKKIKIYF